MRASRYNQIMQVKFCISIFASQFFNNLCNDGELLFAGHLKCFWITYQNVTSSFVHQKCYAYKQVRNVQQKYGNKFASTRNNISSCIGSIMKWVGYDIRQLLSLLHLYVVLRRLIEFAFGMHVEFRSLSHVFQTRTQLGSMHVSHNKIEKWFIISKFGKFSQDSILH